MSEQRIHDLLDGLCTAASANSTLYRVKNGDQYSLVWSDVKEEKSWIAPDKAEKEGMWQMNSNRTSSLNGLDLLSTKQLEGINAALMCLTGRKKEMENYCVRLLDEHEDDLTDILKKDAGDLESILCVRLAKACESNAEVSEQGRNEL